MTSAIDWLLISVEGHHPAQPVATKWISQKVFPGFLWQGISIASIYNYRVDHLYVLQITIELNESLKCYKNIEITTLSSIIFTWNIILKND